ncbi:hypothetical protein F443_20177 [Phytophthora nicotianae P1569]|uniref:Amidohydrolase 3 domain-containing protein n=1 Tax=Phytophthora nicotianae P1569 TaxID=1317065 RepID=V9E1Y6_PHYNI|nr:hypothetical protein F443_20177 [Phytophthora nicotianae P1569]
MVRWCSLDCTTRTFTSRCWGRAPSGSIFRVVRPTRSSQSVLRNMTPNTRTRPGSWASAGPKTSSPAWVVGIGWAQDELSSDARYPSRHDIDAVIRDRPVILHRACWHIAVVNTKALEIAGVDVNAKNHDVKHGAIDVDEKGATGILREDAVQIVEKHANEPSLDLRVKYFRNALTRCVHSGLTAVHTNDEDAWHVYSKLQKEESLPVRVYLTPSIYELGKPSTPKPGASDGLVSVHRMKIFSDGSLGAKHPLKLLSCPGNSGSACSVQRHV